MREDSEQPVGLVSLTTEFPSEVIWQCNRPKVPPLPNLVPLPREAPRLMVPAGTVLLSLGKSVSSSDDWPIIGELEQITDGEKGQGDDYFVELSSGLQWVQIDLGGSCPIHAVAVWHDTWLEQSYHDVVMQIADDPEFREGVTTVYNNDFDNSAGFGAGADSPYVESRFGCLVAVPDVKGRYVRLHSRGNTDSEFNRYIEVEVYGTAE